MSLQPRWGCDWVNWEHGAAVVAGFLSHCDVKRFIPTVTGSPGHSRNTRERLPYLWSHACHISDISFCAFPYL